MNDISYQLKLTVRLQIVDWNVKEVWFENIFVLVFTGNYEEGFGKERYKNKWNAPNSKQEVLPNGQTCLVKEATNGTETGKPSEL